MQLFANNADSSLNGAIASDTTVLVLKAGEGGRFPSPTNGDFFLVTLFQKVGTTELNHEIVKCTSRVGDNLTVVRAQEGTSAKPFNSGDLVELRFTKGTAENFPQLDALATKEPVITAPVSAPTEKYWRGDKTWRDFFTDVRAATLTGLSTATNAVVAATDTVLAAIGKLQAQVSAKFDKTGGDVAGNINITGTGRRITGDFSNATLANRLMFQTNQPNTSTIIGAIPSGSGSESRLTLINNSNTANASGLDFRALSAEMQIRSNTYGAGFLPLTFFVGGAERLRIDTSGNVGVGISSPVATLDVVAANPTFRIGTADNNKKATFFYNDAASTFTIGVENGYGITPIIFRNNGAERLRIDPGGNVLVTGGALGYGVGAGGSVVQATSKSTSVTLNKSNGIITLHPASLAAGGIATFALNNTSISDVDTLSLSFIGSVASVQSSYSLQASTGAGVAFITIRNEGTALLSEAVQFTFKVIKGSIT